MNEVNHFCVPLSDHIHIFGNQVQPRRHQECKRNWKLTTSLSDSNAFNNSFKGLAEQFLKDSLDSNYRKKCNNKKKKSNTQEKLLIHKLEVLLTKESLTSEEELQMTDFQLHLDQIYLDCFPS